jgi:uncharacterized membrane protein YqaE (UPF0057 family)
MPMRGKRLKCESQVRTPHDHITMRLLIALILPWLTFFTIGRPFAGLICLVLQITLIGWIPAAIWAVYALSQYKTDKKIEKALGSH